MKEFIEIFKSAENMNDKNLIFQENMSLSGAETEKKEDSFSIVEMDYSNHISKELFDIIEDCGFDIVNYKKIVGTINEYNNPLEIYECHKNNWLFTITNYNDVEIEDGIFSVTGLNHRLTNEDVFFSCDLSCRNTEKRKMDIFLEFLKCSSSQEYILDKYGVYLALPELLEKAGYTILEKDYNFSISNAEATLKLSSANDLFINLSEGRKGKITCAVANARGNSLRNSEYDYGLNMSEKEYYFDYNKIEDIEEFVKCIKAFESEQAGEIGYYEDERYYGNEDINNLFRKMISDEDYCLWDHNLVKLNNIEYYNGNVEGAENFPIVNKYKGLEIYVQKELIFNYKSRWSKGCYSNTSIITVEYDKTKNKDKCSLRVEYTVYNDELRDPYELDNNCNDKDSRVDGRTIEVLGTFTEIFNYLKEYLNGMCKINGMVANIK